MDDEKLILLVKANECIYSKYSRGYNNPEKKRNVWKDISAQMGYPVKLNMYDGRVIYLISRMRCSYNVCRDYTDSTPQSSFSPGPVHSPISDSSPLPEICTTNLNAEIAQLPAAPAVAKRKQRQESENVHFSEALDVFKKLCEAKTKNQEEEDAITVFGKMITGTIRTFSERKQILAMERVTSLIMKMKLEPETYLMFCLFIYYFFRY